MTTEQTIKIDGTDCTVTAWTKVAGKERLYIKVAANGKEMGFWDVAFSSFVAKCTFGSPTAARMFETAVKEVAAAFALPQTAAPALPQTAAPAPVQASEETEARQERKSNESYAFANLDLTKTEIRMMSDRDLQQAVFHDL